MTSLKKKCSYLLSFLSGNAISAIDLCNSFLFLDLNLFQMNLTSVYKQQLRNNTLLTVVLLENIPQLILQIVFIINNGYNITTIITISMLFSILSIILTSIEIFTKRKLLNAQNILVIAFCVESKYICQLSKHEFKHKIEFNRRKISQEMVKLLNGVNYGDIESLKPTPNDKGVLLTFYLRLHSIANQEITNILISMLKINPHDDNHEKLSGELYRMHSMTMSSSAHDVFAHDRDKHAHGLTENQSPKHYTTRKNSELTNETKSGADNISDHDDIGTHVNAYERMINAIRNEYTLPLNDKPQIVNGCFELFETMTSRHQPDVDASICDCLSCIAIRMLLQNDNEQIVATINSQSS